MVLYFVQIMVFLCLQDHFIEDTAEWNLYMQHKQIIYSCNIKMKLGKGLKSIALAAQILLAVS